MNYQDARPYIKSGDLLAWSHKTWLSWYDIKIQIVRFFTRSEFCHLGTAWVVGDRVFVIEAVIPLVRIYPLSKLGDFYWIPMSAGWSRETECLALSKVGHRYSTWDAIKAPFTKLKNDDVWECAELASRIALSDNINLGTTYVPTDVVEQALGLGKPLYLVKNKKAA